MCARVDRVEQRVDRLITRLSAGPDTRGSVKWSQKRAAAVRSKDAARAELIDGRVGIPPGSRSAWPSSCRCWCCWPG
jgi:hypothetical protein